MAWSVTARCLLLPLFCQSHVADQKRAIRAIAVSSLPKSFMMKPKARVFLCVMMAASAAVSNSVSDFRLDVRSGRSLRWWLLVAALLDLPCGRWWCWWFRVEKLCFEDGICIVNGDVVLFSEMGSDRACVYSSGVSMLPMCH